MTIRYSCIQCGSVLKIKDEKAGTNAKCPKCKAAFVVPTLDEEAWDGELEFEAPAESDRDNEDEPLPAAVRQRPEVTESSSAAPAPSGRRDRRTDDRDNEDPDADEYNDSSDIEDDRETDELPERIELPNDDRSGDDNSDDFEDPDMPLELTPAAPVSNDFDPAGVLGTDDSGRGGARRRTAASAADRKASVADMMKDFGAARKKERASPEAVTVAPVAPAQTAGTAAEALSRAYQQKRENAAHPTPKQAKENLQRQLLFEYLRRTVPPIAVALLLSWGLYSFVTRRVYTGPPLAPVYGQLTRSGTPLVGYQVRLIPVLSAEELNSAGGKGSPPGRSTASGITNDKGEFTIMYSASDRGASIGEHTLEIMEPSGMGTRVPPEYEQQSVPPDGIKSLRIDLP